MWFDGVQRMVYLLQKLKKDGTANYSLCGKITLPRGISAIFISSVFSANLKFIVDGHECGPSTDIRWCLILLDFLYLLDSLYL